MNTLRAAWAWLADNRGPLAWLSVLVKCIRAVAWLPLLYYLMPEHAPFPAWLAFWLIVVTSTGAWFLDSVLDADGSGT